MQTKYQSEQQLLKALELQIAKIEKFITDLQQDYQWQRIFYKHKLYLNLSPVFNRTHTEYSRYLEDIISDYKILRSSTNKEIKEFYIEQLQNKIFVLFKMLRNLRKYANKKESLQDRIAQKQELNAKLYAQQNSLTKMLELLNKQYQVMHKQLVYGKADDAQVHLQKKIMALLDKKGKLEQELFSVKERLRLNDTKQILS